MIPLRGGDLVTFHGHYWLNLGGNAVNDTASGGEHTVEFVYTTDGVHVCSYGSFTLLTNNK